jgi:hypothetical protein
MISARCNIRAFEAMAAGALVPTSLPTELAQAGFEMWVHFVDTAKKRKSCRLYEILLEESVGAESPKWRAMGCS